MVYSDIQVNGGYGLDFNSPGVSPEKLGACCQLMEREGVNHFLPTIITDSLDQMCERLQALAHARQQCDLAQRLIPGFHVEGPFISPIEGFVGAHPREHVMSATVGAVDQLLEASGGLVKILTLAPEQDESGEVIAHATSRGIKVMAGHTNATIDQLSRSIDCGLVGFTHYGNGCPIQLERHDNILNRVFALRDKLVITLIADGVHLPRWLLKSLLKTLDPNTTVIVTDRISASGMPAGRYPLGRSEVDIGNDGIARTLDRKFFAGSTATMPMMERILNEIYPSNPSQITKWLSANANQFLTAN